MAGLSAIAPAARIVDTVQGALRLAILDGSLAPGEQLSVPGLARRLNVSRSPVREAVLGLVAEGLAVEQPRRGVVVVTVEIADLLAIHEIREFLEAGSARLCAERIEEPAIRELQGILGEQEAAVRACDPRGYFATNAAFHRAIAVQSGNARLKAILATLEQQMQLALRKLSADTDHMAAAVEEHRRIVERIVARDADGTERLMRLHVASTMTRLRKLIASE